MKRLPYLDFLKAIATIAVIVIHVAAQNWYQTAPDTDVWKAFNAFDSVVRWAVPVFVMVSGALFLNRDIPIKKLYTRYILRIVIAFIFWSAVYTVDRCLHGNTGNLLSTFFHGHYHMWFLFMIVGLYMMVPILKMVISNEKATVYFLATGFVFAIIIPEMQAVLDCVWGYTKLDYIFDKMDVKIVTTYSFYFVLGYYMSQREFRHIWPFVLSGIAGFTSTIILSYVISVYKGQQLTLFYENETVNVMMESICIFALSRKFYNCENKIIGVIRRYSFGIYLVHPLVISELNNFTGLNTLTFGSPVLGVVLVTIIVFAISFVISFALSCIPILKKYVI